MLKISGTAPNGLQFRWTFPGPLPAGLDPEARTRMIEERATEIALEGVPRGPKRETPYPLSVCRTPPEEEDE